VFVAAIPSLAAAWLAPFPQSDSKDDDTSVDDPERLGKDDRTLQDAARRATIPALLATALFLLFPDILAFGWLSSATSGTWLVFLLLLIATSTVLKVGLSIRAIAAGRAALALSRQLTGGKAYVSNAKGAVIGGAVMLAVSFGVAVAGVQRATSTDWSCAFSGNAASCLAAPEAKSSQCVHPTVNR
jgi:hypothetical protein